MLLKMNDIQRYENFTDLCVDFYDMLDHIHDYSEYRVDGSKCALTLAQ